jgi:type II secretory pathway pseudopilin PulG
MLMTRRFSRGDTIIELVLAFAIFSMCAVTTIMILNKGVAVSQRSIEKSLVRQQIDSQSEIIRYLHDTYNPKWNSFKTMITANPLPLSGPCPSVGSLGGGAHGFFVVPDDIDPDGFVIKSAVSPQYSIPTTYARVDYDAQKAAGIWVQVVKAENNSGNPLVDAYDFYIHGCWDSVGLNVPMTVGTIVRIYGN